MTLIRVAMVFCICLTAAFAQQQDVRVIPLWDNAAPGAQGTEDRDIPTIQFIVILLATFYVFMNILTDVIALLATPRRRLAR